MKAINPNSFAYFMGVNARTINRPKNPFPFGSQAATDWLNGFVTRQQELMVKGDKVARSLNNVVTEMQQVTAA